jgi:hypothetical protein
MTKPLFTKKTVPPLRPVKGSPAWSFASNRVRAALTREAGSLGPVGFKLGSRWVEPLHLAPWHSEKETAHLPPLLRNLRGDFFCMPFGGNDTPYRGERHPAHGETANALWQSPSLVREDGVTRLEVSLKTRIRPGLVRKQIELREGETTLYQRHILEGFSGPMNLGHHTNLHFRDGEGSGRISTSRFIHGQVFPGQFENPAKGGYSSLRPGAVFKDLRKVPRSDGAMADLTRYPARSGYEDLVMISADPKLKIGWTAAVFLKERHVWFALKDPHVLASTVFWITNGGRHYPPWNGRHRNTIGLEEVTSAFHGGLAESVEPNNLTRLGIPTMLKLNPRRPLTINYIMGVAAVPAGFEEVAAITPAKGGITLLSTSGKKIFAPVRVEFLWETAA